MPRVMRGMTRLVWFRESVKMPFLVCTVGEGKRGSLIACGIAIKLCSGVALLQIPNCPLNPRQVVLHHLG